MVNKSDAWILHMLPVFPLMISVVILYNVFYVHVNEIK
jgi:hypothetical protein